MPAGRLGRAVGTGLGWGIGTGLVLVAAGALGRDSRAAAKGVIKAAIGVEQAVVVSAAELRERAADLYHEARAERDVERRAVEQSGHAAVVGRIG